VLDVAARRVSLDLISLASGRVARVPVSLTPQSAEGQTLAWSPDGRWLFVVAGSGRLAVVNPRTGRASRLLAWLPPVSQIAVRS
jgi:hypothetical protein